MPWNEYFEWFGPRYRLEVVKNNMEDMNVKDGSLNKIRYVYGPLISLGMPKLANAGIHNSETALRHLSELRPAPSVGLQDVPSESIGEHLGFSSREIQTDELDEKLAREYWSQLSRPSLISCGQNTCVS